MINLKIGTTLVRISSINLNITQLKMPMKTTLEKLAENMRRKILVTLRPAINLAFRSSWCSRLAKSCDCPSVATKIFRRAEKGDSVRFRAVLNRPTVRADSMREGGRGIGEDVFLPELSSKARTTFSPKTCDT